MGGDTQIKSYGVLRPGGSLVTLISPPDQELAKKQRVAASWMIHQSDGARLGLLAALCDAGALTVVVDSDFSLAETKAALAYSASGHAKGKILLGVH